MRQPTNVGLSVRTRTSGDHHSSPLVEGKKPKSNGNGLPDRQAFVEHVLGFRAKWTDERNIRQRHDDSSFSMEIGVRQNFRYSAIDEAALRTGVETNLIFLGRLPCFVSRSFKYVFLKPSVEDTAYSYLELLVAFN